MKKLNSLRENDGKFRNELKYIVTDMELKIIEERIKYICSLDKNAGDSGIYSLRSVYFDDMFDTCLKENENGTDPREKFRIRVYNGSDARISLECKRKDRLMTNKKSVLISREIYEDIINERLKPDLTKDTPPLLRKFYEQYLERELRPKTITVYDRTPYVYGPGNVRITFDRNISSSVSYDKLFESFKERLNTKVGRLVSDEELNEEFIMPEPFDPRVADVVAAAVKANIK